MIAVTRLDGETVFINERNIQWVEALPDTSVTFLGGARLIIREKMNELIALIASANSASTARSESSEASP
jgi:flagellar protein FlbD